MIRWVRRAVLAGLLLTPSPPAASGQDPSIRAALPPEADRNSWEAFYDYGVSQLRRDPARAATAFSWASRLAPDRAEPLYAQWVSYWLTRPDRWVGYVEGRRDVLREPEVIRVDSLQYRAFLRNPFVHVGLAVLIYERMPGRWQRDALTRAWIAYGAADFASAAQRLGQVIARDSVKNLWVRWLRASTLISMRSLDSALVEMTALLRQLRQAEQETLVEAYRSKEMVLYGIGLLQEARRRSVEAREALGEALVENLAFAPARRALARLARAQRDAATAISELAQAVEVDGDDPVLRYEYGEALLAGGRPADAAEQLRLAVEKEPWWGEPHFALGRALEATGADAAAADA